MLEAYTTIAVALPIANTKVIAKLLSLSFSNFLRYAGYYENDL